MGACHSTKHFDTGGGEGDDRRKIILKRFSKEPRGNNVIYFDPSFKDRPDEVFDDTEKLKNIITGY